MILELWTAFVLSFWILFPAYAANSFPTFVRVYKIKTHPIDFGKSFRGNRIFGEGKTIEGFLLGLIAGFLIGLAEVGLYPSLNLYAQTFGTSLPNMNILIAFLIPLGALTGDLVKSFFKRRIGMKRGSSLMFFDQLDFVIGVVLFTFMFIEYTTMLVIMMFIITFLTHRTASIIGYGLKIKREPW